MSVHHTENCGHGDLFKHYSEPKRIYWAQEKYITMEDILLSGSPYFRCGFKVLNTVIIETSNAFHLGDSNFLLD